MNPFDEALTSLQEAIDYERGNHSKGRSVSRALKLVAPLKEYSGEDIKRIRLSLNYTQSYFGAILGVSLKSVQSWEYNLSKPSGAAKRVIAIIEMGEEFLEEAGLMIKQA